MRSCINKKIFTYFHVCLILKLYFDMNLKMILSNYSTVLGITRCSSASQGVSQLAGNMQFSTGPGEEQVIYQLENCTGTNLTI